MKYLTCDVEQQTNKTFLRPFFIIRYVHFFHAELRYLQSKIDTKIPAHYTYIVYTQNLNILITPQIIRQWKDLLHFTLILTGYW